MRLKYISPLSLLFGVLMFGGSVFIGYYAIPHRVREKILENSKLVKGNTRFNNWEVIPVPLFQRIYLFNVSNPEEVIKGGKPILQELGPYVYQQKRRKFDIVFNHQNDTIFYKERTNYFFRSDLSNGSLSDRVTFINLPYVSAANKATLLNPVTRYVIQQTLHNYKEEKLYVSRTAGELLFDGYYTPFMKDLSELKGEEILPNNTFGLYYKKNGTDQGRFEIYSGDKNPEKFGNVVTWNGKKKLDWWGDDQFCNQINGSDGGVYAPFATKERDFIMFIPGLCRSFRFEFETDQIQVKGIPTNKYSLPASFFESAKTNPDNACYCSNPGENYEKCPESGVFDMTGCGKVGMMLSLPHFYLGSPLYLNQSVGLNPQKDRHEMALLIETYTSSTVTIHMRFQMNINLYPNKFFRPLKKIPQMIHPVFWMDQTVVIPDESASTLRDRLHGTINLTRLLCHIGIILGGILIVCSLLLFFLCGPREDTKEDKIEQISFTRQGTFAKGKISFSTNGAVPNGKSVQIKIEKPTVILEESRPFLQPIGNPVTGTTESNEVSSQGTSSSKYTQNHQKAPESNPVISMNPTCQADSRLSPFPTKTDYPSSLSITDKVLNDTLEATSSYENL